MALHPVLRWTALVLAPLLVVALALTVGLHGGTGERLIAERLQQAVPGLALDGFTITWPFTFTARTVDVADADGVWLHMEKPSLSWHPSRLLRRIVSMEQVSADQVIVHRMPRDEGKGGGAGFPRLGLRADTIRVPILLKEPVLGEAVKLDLAGTFRLQSGGGAVDVHLQAARGGIIRLVGSAAPDFLDLRWYIQVPEMARWQRLLGIETRGQLAGTGLLAGRLPSPVIDGNVDLADFTLAGWGGKRLTMALRALPSATDWKASLRASIDQPRGAVPLPPQVRVEAVGDVDPVSGMLRLGSANVVAGANRLRLNGIIADWGKQSDIRASAVMDDARGLVPALGGRATARAVISGDLTGPDLRARLRVTGHSLTTGIAILDRLLGNRPEARLLLAVSGQNVRLLSGQVDGEQANLIADGLAWPRVDLHARAQVADLSVFAPQLKGSGVARGRVAGSYDNLATWGLVDLDVEPVAGDVSFDFSLAGRPQGHVGADLLYQGRAVTASAQIITGPQTRIESLQIASRGSRVSGVLMVGDDVSGRLKASIPDLGQWLPGIQGGVEAEADVGGPVVTLRADARDLRAAGITVPSLSAAGQVQDGSATIGRLAFSVWRQRIALAAPAHVQWGPEFTRLEPARLAIGGGTLLAEGEVRRGQLAGAFRLDNLPLALVETVMPLTDAAGDISGLVTLAGTLEAPIVDVKLNGAGVGFAAAARAGMGNLTVEVDARMADRRVTGSASARDGNRLRVSVTGSAGLEGPVDARIDLTGDLAQITDTLPLAGHLFAGRLAGQAQITGTVDDPRVDGRVNLANGRYENVDYGTVVAGLEAEMRLAGTSATLRATGTDGRRGTAELTGAADLDGNWQADLGLDRFRAMWRDDVHAVAAAQLEASGQGRMGRIGGSMIVEGAEIDIARLQGGGPVSLDVVEINRPGPRVESKPTAQVVEGGPEELALDVDVTIRRAFVRGRGLDSEWGGSVAIGGNAAQPSLNGSIRPERGRYEFLGKAFELSRDSIVAFEPGRGLSPRLDIIAEADAGDVTARVAVTGDASAPQIEISSEPPLPRDEVLSRVLFGTEPGKLSAFQQIQLGQMAAGSLTGGGDGFDPIGSLRGALDLDVLEVGSAEDGKNGETGGPTLSAGKYIGKNTFLRVEQGAEGLGSVILEREIGRGLSITTELGQQAGSGAGIEWRKNY